MEKIIRKRWTVDGFYRYSRQTSAWEYEHAYREGRVVWEFGDEVLTCLIDGHADHTVPYTISQGDTLLMDYSAFIPHFNRYTERYKIEDRGGELWLYDLTSQIPEGGFWLAIKLLPEE
jgi:hypothetical protein